MEFFQLESAGGVVLILATSLALFFANSPFASSYFRFWRTDASLPGTHLSLAHWINDGLMAIFFLVAGAEIKRELVCGELSSVKKAALPIAAAMGGMAVPAGIYLAFNQGSVFQRGWGIPMATDIAFSLGILALLGSRIPLALKVFLTALAIVDDLGAILVIAIFYSSSLNWGALGIAALLLALLALANRFGVKALSVYLLTGAVVWFCFLNSGVHATVAGVLVGLLIPVGPQNQSNLSDENGQSQTTEESLVDRLIHALHPFVAFGIVPLFALANAGISFSGIGASKWQHSVPLGIILGLFLGKPIGILGFCWITTKVKLGHLPQGVQFRQLAGASLLAGIGFTMSLFIAELAFPGASMLPVAKLGILLGSLASAICGYFWLRFTPESTVTAEV